MKRLFLAAIAALTALSALASDDLESARAIYSCSAVYRMSTELQTINSTQRSLHQYGQLVEEWQALTSSTVEIDKDTNNWFPIDHDATLNAKIGIRNNNLVVMIVNQKGDNVGYKEQYCDSSFCEAYSYVEGRRGAQLKVQCRLGRPEPIRPIRPVN